MGREQGLTDDEIVDGLMEIRQRKDRRGARAMDGEDRRAAAAFDMAAAGVPPELGGFGYGNGGEDIEFGVDQADWQIAQADDKDIEARNRKRAIQAAADIGFDARMIEQGDGARVRRAQAMMELREGRARAENVNGRTDFRMQFGPRDVQGTAQIPFLNPIAVNDGRLEADPFLVGERGRDGNLRAAPDQQRRIFAKFGRDGKVAKRKDGNPILPHRDALAREPNFAGGGNQQAILDAQIRLVNAVRKGEVSAQEAAPIIQKLNMDLNPRGGRGVAVKNPALEADRREAAAVRANEAIGAAGMLRAVQNDADAELEAKIIGLRGGINRNMSALPDIKDVGNLKVKLPAKAGGFNEGQFFPEAVQDGIAPAFDEKGVPLGIQGPVIANTVDPGQVVNAPRDVRQWAIQNAPSFKEGGRVFGDFPQVEIMGAGNDFLERIGRIKARGQEFDPGISAIRNIDDLEGVVQRFGGFAQAGGLKMFALDENNNEVYRSQVGLPEIFQKMKMNENAQGRLANAVFQLEAGKVNGVNADQRAVFEGRAVPAQPWRSNPAENVIMGARLPEFGNDEVQLQKIPRGQIQIGVDAVGEPIKQEKMAALQALSGRQAQPPLDANELRDARNGLVGLAQGEGRGRESVFGFAKRIPDGVEPRAFFREQAIERAKPGKQPNFARVRENADRWQRIVDREKAARNAPNEVLGVQQTGERDIRFKDALINMEARNRIEPGIAQGKIDELRGGRPAPVAQAEGGGMGEGPRPPVVAAVPTPDPWQTPPATGGGFTEQSQKRMPTSMLNTLAELNSGPRQGPVPGSARKQFTDRAKFISQSPRMKTQRRVGYGAAGVAGLAGLNSLINGERDSREQEAQY